MFILGISSYYHDSAACILKMEKSLQQLKKKDSLVKKHGQNFPVNAINYCLKEAGISTRMN